MESPPLFVASVILILVTPGPTNTLLATAGGTVGFFRALPLLLCEILGYSISIGVIHIALAPIIGTSQSVGTVMRIAAGTYLLFLAFKIWKTDPQAPGGVVSARQVFLTTLFNPKAALFALSIIPFYSDHASTYVIGFEALLPLIGLGWIAAGALLRFNSSARHSRVFPRFASIALVIFSAILFFSAISTVASAK
jgi:threonine/homoserine/homoserine lactone efflux protein